MSVTEERKEFMGRLNAWAKANGYKRIAHLWQAKDHYLSVRRSADGSFDAEKREYGTGAHLSDVTI